MPNLGQVNTRISYVLHEKVGRKGRWIYTSLPKYLSVSVLSGYDKEGVTTCLVTSV